MFVLVVIRHGSGKVFQYCKTPIFQQKVEDCIVLILHPLVMKNGFVILA